MLDWLRRHDPGRVFIETPDETLTFGAISEAVNERRVEGTEVVQPALDFRSVINLIAVMAKGAAVVSENAIDTSSIDPAGAASVVFTSGSSGGRKGVRLTLDNWEAAARASMDHLGHGPDDTWLLALPLHHVAGLSIIVRSAYSGGAVRMLPGFDPVTYATHLRRGVTVASMVPTMISRVLEVDPGPFPGLNAVLLGGGPIPDRLLEQAHASGLPVLPTYGLTETAGQVATLRPGQPVENKAYPLPGVMLRIESEGLIAVRGPMVSPGYVGEPDRGAEDWLVTGDLGTIDRDGALRVTGRADTIIVSGGENIDPAVVEAAVVRVAGVEKALVAGLASERWGMEAVCLYVGKAEPSRVEAELRHILPGFMIPKRWLQVADLPLTPLGKPDRVGAVTRFT
ncbi:MAG: AMP-binding protein [Acidimicrobiia bacterium]